MYKNNKNKQMKYANKVVYQYRKMINKRIKRKERYPYPTNLLFISYIWCDVDKIDIDFIHIDSFPMSPYFSSLQFV